MKVKLYDWKPEETLKTPEAQREFLVDAAEDGNPVFMARSMAVVMRARGLPNVGAILDGVADICTATGAVNHKTGQRRKPATRALAMA